jgi:MFS-type transporter involved in bile tolerance (Atg22 family)
MRRDRTTNPRAVMWAAGAAVAGYAVTVAVLVLAVRVAVASSPDIKTSVGKGITAYVVLLVILTIGTVVAYRVALATYHRMRRRTEDN